MACQSLICDQDCDLSALLEAFNSYIARQNVTIVKKPREWRVPIFESVFVRDSENKLLINECLLRLTWKLNCIENMCNFSENGDVTERYAIVVICHIGKVSRDCHVLALSIAP